MNRLPIFVVACTFSFASSFATFSHAQDADKLFRQWAEERMQMLVKEKDPKERAKAAEYLGGSKFPDANAALGAALADADVRVREAAAAALWKSGKGAEPARAQLMKALDDPAPQVSMNAAGALQMLGVKPEELVAARQRALASPDASRYIRFIAARGLIDLVPPLPLLEPMLAFLEQSAASRSDAGKHNTGLAEKALANLVETKERALIPPLQEALQRAQHGQAVLLKTLAKFEPQPDAFTATLLPFLESREPTVREAALDLLGAQKNEDDVAQWAPRVAALLGDADRNVRWRAAWNLGKPGGLAAREIDRLVAAMNDSDVSVRRAAARSIGEIGEAKQAVVAIAKNTIAERARPALVVAAEKDSDSEVHSAANEALKKLVEKPLPVPANASAEAAGMRLLRERSMTFERGMFFRALTGPDVPLIRAFLDGGMSVGGDIDSVGPPLRAALFGGRGCSPRERPTKPEVKHMLRLLIERGADVNAGDQHGNTALSEAASKGCDRETIKILLAAGAKIGNTNSAGLTAFEMGLYSGHDGLEELIAAGYRLTPEKAKAYAQGYATNPAALALIKKATKK